MKTELQVQAEVEITINDPDVIERITGPQGDDWRSSFYQLYTEEEVLEHLAINSAAGIERVNQLDGWADLPASAGEMQVLRWMAEVAPKRKERDR